MSNTRRPKWSAAEVNAANAEQLLAELAAVVAVEDSPKSQAMLLQVWDVLDGQGRADEFAAVADQLRADAMRRVIACCLERDIASARAQLLEGKASQYEMLLARMGELDDQWWADCYRNICQQP